MRTLLIPIVLAAALYGCQPDTPTQQTAVPAANPPAPAAPVETVVAKTPTAAATPVPAADDSLTLAKSYGCMVCHTIDKKTIGPAWKDVAAKYRGDKDAEAKLMDKVLKGGAGVWGNVPMPPNPKPSEEERRKMVKLVLSLS
ncbi:MAG: cytochrome C [Gallionellaceae bacterium]|nr:cytochrome C [Gallionellaceae bacterium]